MTTTTTLPWNQLLLDQLEHHWVGQLRPRLDGLTDDEYLWEPVPGAWNVHVDGDRTTIDFAYPEPVPTPVTTISWRLAHLVVGVLGARNASHFGGPPADYETWTYPATADGALAQLDEATPAGSRASAASARRAWPGRADRPRVRTPTSRWRRWSPTSTAR